MRSSNRQPRLTELGTDLLHLTRWQKIRALSLPFIACTAFWILATLHLWVAAVIALMVLSFVTYGSTSHDLVHGSLGLPKRTNDILLALIEALALRSGHAYQVAHLHHHARFPHADDIEAAAARMSLTRTLLEGVVFQYRIYAWALRYPHGRLPWIVAERFAVLSLIAAALAALPWTIVPAVYVALMIVGSWSIPLITSYLPHQPAASDPLHQTRLFRGWLVRCLAFDHLYHLEHHLYPLVPHQNWPKLAHRLDPWFDSQGVKPQHLWFSN